MRLKGLERQAKEFVLGVQLSLLSLSHIWCIGIWFRGMLCVLKAFT